MVECGYGDWLKATGDRMRSPQRRGVRKDDTHEGNRGEQPRSTSQSVSEMGARGNGEDKNCTKPVMEVMGGATRLVGEDWADSESRRENNGTGDVDKDNRYSCSLFLGAQTSCSLMGLSWQQQHVRCTYRAWIRVLG